MSTRPLSAALLRKAESEINEKPKRIQSDILALREWLKKQPHLETIKPNDQWIISFLRGCKHSLERSKEKFEMYYTLKSVVPEFFSNRDPMSQSLQEILKLGVFLPLRECEKEDSARVCILRLGVFDPSLYHLSDVIKVAFMITEILMLEDNNFTVAGEEAIVDLKGVGMNVISQWTPAFAKKVTSCFEKALPVRVKSTHILNTPAGFDMAYGIFKTFLSEKLKKRIRVHSGNLDENDNEFMSVLPLEYEGKDGTINELTEYWKQKVESYRDWFIKEENVKSNESKRPGKPKTSSTLFGVEGSFRSLEVD